jgi:Holliday junction DNA helicase RuvA
MILSSLNPHEIQQAILSNNVTTLQSVKGIGGKTAQRIILDLKDKVIKLDLGNSSTISHNTVKDEALSALTMLGFNKNSIEKVIDKELQGASDLGVEEVVKRVLKKM